MLLNCGVGEASWTARSNQSILKEISPEYSLEGLMLKLKLQYFGYLMRRADPLEKTLMLKVGGERDDRGWDGWMASPTQWTWFWVHPRSWWWTRRPGMLQSMGSQRVGHGWVTELNLECLLGPTIELVIAGCIKSTFRHMSQSDQEVVPSCCVKEREKMTFQKQFFFFNFQSAQSAYVAFSPFQFASNAKQL